MKTLLLPLLLATCCLMFSCGHQQDNAHVTVDTVETFSDIESSIRDPDSIITPTDTNAISFIDSSLQNQPFSGPASIPGDSSL